MGEDIVQMKYTRKQKSIYIYIHDINALDIWYWSKIQLLKIIETWKCK